MNEDQARTELESILTSASPGEEATVQSEGQVEHPHPHEDETTTDAWKGTKQEDGSVEVEKIYG